MLAKILQHIPNRKKLNWLLIAFIIFLCVWFLSTWHYSLYHMPAYHKAYSSSNEAIPSKFLESSIPSDSPKVNKQRVFPQAIIIGVRKAGTRALLNMLSLHPRIMSAREEVHFFDRRDNFDKGISWYINRMPLTSPDQITIEKTPSYFTHKEVPQRLSALSADIKLLLIVREPVERALSDYTQLSVKQTKRFGNTSSFEKLVFAPSPSGIHENYPPISISIYSKFFVTWLKYFQRSQILIVDGDDLIRNPLHELQNVEKFLDIGEFFVKDMFYYNDTKGFYCWKKTSNAGNEMPYCLGNGKGREHPIVSDEVRSKLKLFFKPHNKEFFKLTGQTFDW